MSARFWRLSSEARPSFSDSMSRIRPRVGRRRPYVVLRVLKFVEEGRKDKIARSHIR